MKMIICAMKDTVTGEFQSLFLQHNEQDALRSVAEAVNSPAPNYINKNLKDMQLFNLGKFDTKTGEITPEVFMIKNAIELKTARRTAEVNRDEENL